MLNPMTFIDGYKLDHRRQYPPGTTRVYSNFTPRSSRVEGVEEVVFFGLQYFLQHYLMEKFFFGFFGGDKDRVLERYKRRVDSYLGPNEIGTKHIADLFDLGYWPIEFRALAEGTLCPLRVPMLTMENTHPDFAWVVNYLETLLSNSLWMPCTSATTALRYRRLLNCYAEMTGGDASFVDWQAHDFSFRGMSSVEAAALSGAAHLLSFRGTDTMPALDLVEDYYGPVDGILGGSVAATEHSVMCAGGQEGERETFLRLLQLYPKGIVSVVSDTWNLWMVLNVVLPSLREEIMAREGKLVIRPDSGDPVKILCGDPDSKLPDSRKGVVELLWKFFGGTVNAKGFKVLDPHIGVIYGDSITPERALAIVAGLREKGFASTNVVLGIGSYTYQMVTRDTYGFALKATEVVVEGEARAIFKDPVTDDGVKKSARGRLAVLRNYDSGELELFDQANPHLEAASLLRPVWRDGKFLKRHTFGEIRERLRAQW